MIIEIICKNCRNVWITNTFDDDYCDECVIAGMVKEKEGN